MKGRILLVDDDRAFRLSTAALLRQDGHDVVAVSAGKQAAEALEAGTFDLLILDFRMPGIDGIALAEVLRRRGHAVPILMITGFGSVDRAVEALHGGVDDFLTKPIEPDVLSARVDRLLERRPQLPDNGASTSRESRVTSLESPTPAQLATRSALDRAPRAGAPGAAPAAGGVAADPLERLVGRSASIAAVRERVRLVAPTDASVLVLGETGVGKELVARAIHELSPRSRHPFIGVNTAALAGGILESELFGHVRGAFTGAVQRRDGLFRAAHGGTLLLDEIGDIDAAVQRRLLRVLQEQEIVPLGSTQAVQVDVRIIAATSRDLRVEVDAGRFREDLLYRLDVFRIEIPPLRERKTDIPLLVEAFVNARSIEPRPACSPLTMRLLQAHTWPGNVRELFAALESALIHSRGERIEAQHLPESVRRANRSAGARRVALQSDEPHAEDIARERYRQALSPEAERIAIRRALDEAGGVRARAAILLGMGRTTLWRKMKEHGLDDAESG